jgi:ferredoxin/flavodoxin
MSLIRLLLGRRQFLVTFLSSTLVLTFGRAARALDLIFKTDAAKASEKPAAGGKKSLKGIVVFYSSTGNTAQIANALYKGMKSVISCDVATVKQVKPADMAKYDVIALGSPNWYMREVANTKVFTHDMPVMRGKHCIIFGTHGGSPLGQFWSMSRNVIKKGMTIIGWSDWYGSDFMTPHSAYPDGEWGHPDEVDLAEAEAFGRKMAEYSIRIYAGETNLIPEIPQPDKGQQSLWSPLATASGHITFASPPPDSIPVFDLRKCVYPRCTQCVENCPINAIDFSVMASAGSIISLESVIPQDRLFVLDTSTGPTPTVSPLILKEACQHCGGMCQRVCNYDAVAYEGEKIKIEINPKKCTYPKCTICSDECPQSAIDLTKFPDVVIHNRCEAEGLCWGVCPENAIEAPNMAAIQLKKAWYLKNGMGGPAGMPAGGAPGQAAGAGGPGGGQAPGGMMMRHPARFRSLVRKEDEEQAVGILFVTKYPRVPINKKLWPYEVEKG